MPKPIVVFIHGPAASGKLTIAKELSALTGLHLFHNHLTVDLLLALFPFGHPAFVRLREEIWTNTVREAVSAGVSLIFTFAPERTVTLDFPKVFAKTVCSAGGQIAFAEVRCPEAEIERRMTERRDAVIKALTDLQEQYTKAGKLDEAVAIRDYLRAGGPPRSRRP